MDVEVVRAEAAVADKSERRCPVSMDILGSKSEHRARHRIHMAVGHNGEAKISIEAPVLTAAIVDQECLRIWVLSLAVRTD